MSPEAPARTLAGRTGIGSHRPDETARPALRQQGSQVIRERPLNVPVRPVSGMAEGVPTRKDIANIHVYVRDQGVVWIAQRLKRPAQRVVLVIIIFPDKVGVWGLDRYPLRTRYAALGGPASTGSCSR